MSILDNIPDEDRLCIVKRNNETFIGKIIEYESFIEDYEGINYEIIKTAWVDKYNCWICDTEDEDEWEYYGNDNENDKFV